MRSIIMDAHKHIRTGISGNAYKELNTTVELDARCGVLHTTKYRRRLGQQYVFV